METVCVARLCFRRKPTSKESAESANRTVADRADPPVLKCVNCGRLVVTIVCHMLPVAPTEVSVFPQIACADVPEATNVY